MNIAKNLGGEWDVGRRIINQFGQSIPDDHPDFSYRWGSGKGGGNTLVFDLGWFKRSWSLFKENIGGYYQVGVNHINWIPDDWYGLPPSDRWDALGLTIEPMKEGGPNVLAIGQVADDAQHGLSYDEMDSWLDARGYLRYRPHPQGEQGKPERTLDEDLEWCDRVLTYNSTDGLEALRRGIPVTCSDNCFYSDVARGLKLREDLFHRMAYAQWTEEEISDGTVYQAYKKYLL